MKAFLLLLLILGLALIKPLSSKGTRKRRNAGPCAKSSLPIANTDERSGLSSRGELKIIDETDHGLYVSLTLRIPENLGHGTDTCRIEIMKNGDLAVKVEDYKFNVKTKKWVDGPTYFCGKAPSGFIELVRNKWASINGPIPERPKRSKQKKIDGLIIEFEEYEVKVNLQILARFTESFRVESFNNPSEFYLVNLSQVNCSCPDFHEKRNDLAKDRVDRLCKHLVKVLYENWEATKESVPDDFFHSEIKWLYDRGKGVGYRMWMNKGMLTIGFEEFTFFTSYTRSGWLNLYCEDPEGNFSRFGFNPAERRWAWGVNPFPEGARREVNSKLIELCKKLENA